MAQAQQVRVFRPQVIDREKVGPRIGSYSNGPIAAKLVTDREVLYAGLRLRRRRAQIAARHACEEASCLLVVRLERAS